MHKLFVVTVVMLMFGCALYGQPALTSGGTVNAADYSRDFAPGAIISLFGTNLAAVAGGAMALALPTSLAGTNVELVIGGSVQSLPLFYVSSGQINAQLPYGLTGTAQIRVRSASGVSGVDTISVNARAPKLFTVDFSGTGSGIVTDPSFKISTQTNPAKPGDTIILWMNGLGETTPPVTAGYGAPGGTGVLPATISDPVTVTIGGRAATVAFAGAAPGYAGLYQVNVQAPFVVLTGPLNLQVSTGGVSSQASVTVPYRQLGFYNAVLGGKPVSGQAVNGVSALAIRASDPIAYPTALLNQWVHPGTPSPIDSSVSGEALTLKNGPAIVFDNNGIEDNSGASFYNNKGGGPDTQKAGFVNVFSMSNYFPLVYSTYVKLSQPATISEMIAYLDPNGNSQLPLDTANPYVKYRINIWSNASGAPKETGGYVGDVFSSDTSAGTFSVTESGVNRVSVDPAKAPCPIWRLDYKLTNPITLPAGEYWFSHDAAVRDTPAKGSNTTSVTVPELAGMVRMPSESRGPTQFSFFGKDMTYQESWTFPFAVEVRPTPMSIKEFR